MLSGVDWLSYWLFISGAALIWWTGVIAIFYRKQLLRIISGKRSGRQPDVVYAEEEPVSEPPASTVTTDPIVTVQKLIAEIKMVFASVTPETPHEYIRSSLKLIIQSHQHIRYSEYQQALNELMQSGLSRIGRGPLSQEDIDLIWKKEE